MLSAQAKRTRELSASNLWGVPTVGFPEMEKANVRVAFTSILAASSDNPTKIPVKPCYETPEEACSQGLYRTRGRWTEAFYILEVSARVPVKRFGYEG